VCDECNKIRSLSLSVVTFAIGACRLIGSQGSNVKRMSEQYDVTIAIPAPDEITSDVCTVTISGPAEATVWMAADSIRGSLKWVVRSPHSPPASSVRQVML
jgi:hypothetical protein